MLFQLFLCWVQMYILQWYTSRRGHSLKVKLLSCVWLHFHDILCTIYMVILIRWIFKHCLLYMRVGNSIVLRGSVSRVLTLYFHQIVCNQSLWIVNLNRLPFMYDNTMFFYYRPTSLILSQIGLSTLYYCCL